MTVEERIEALERRTAALETRLSAPARTAVEPARRPLPPATVSAATPPRPLSPAPSSSAPAPSSPDPRTLRESSVPLEDALGGRLLGWVGGAAVALGLCFLLAVAVSNGWLGEIERTVLAGCISLALLAGGARAHGRGRTDASRAAAAAGIVGLFATCVVAGSVYELVPVVVALIGALAVGAVATALAVRWDARGIAGLGVLGALASPALVGTFASGEAVALLLVATSASTAVLLWRRWTWLALGSFAIAAPQWSAFLLVELPTAPVALAVLVAFGALTAAAAVGFELRSSTPTMRIGSIVLMAVNALVLGTIGVAVLGPAAADGWLVALALAHVAAGFLVRSNPDELRLVMLTLGVVLADVAAARLLDGVPLIVTWVAGGVLFAALVGRATGDREQGLVLAGLGGHLLLALSHAVVAAPPETLAGAPEGFAGVIGLALVASGSLVSARLAADGAPEVRALLDAAAAAVLGYQTAIALDGLALTLAFAAEGIALAVIARRRPEDGVALGAAIGFSAVTLLQVLVVHAPPTALVGGLEAPGAAAIALAAAALAVAAIPRWTVAVRGAAVLVVLYTLSVLVVTPFQPGPDAAGLPLEALDVRQQGQALLSALWGLAGVAALVAGLLRDDTVLRRGALALLALTAAKVFVFDLASLTSLYRATSFVVLGLLLLAGAFAWQRVRPRPLPDLRTVTESLR